MPASYRKLVPVAVAAAAIVAVFQLEAIPQDPAYHDFADARRIFGIPNFWNVASNLPFLLVGVAGLARAHRLAEDALRAHYLVMCASITLIAAGSGFYHYAPSTSALVWDRLPMTIAFMALFSAVIADRLSWLAGRALLGPLVVLGLGSIAWWVRTEALGQGDLRPYAIVQFLPALLIPLILLLNRDGQLGNRWLWGAFAAYAAAKAAEYYDAGILSAGQLLSGHSLKHLLSALAALWMLRAFFGNGPAQRSPASAL